MNDKNSFFHTRLSLFLFKFLRISTTTQPPTIENKTPKKKKQLAKVWWGWRNWGCLKQRERLAQKRLCLSLFLFTEKGER